MGLSAKPPVKGPFAVKVVGVEQPALTATMYALRVMGKDGEHTVHRRYSCFYTLREEMEDAGRQLPEMPPKSFFRKNVSAQFMLERAMGLREVVRAAAAADPHATTPALRDFLGLAPPTSSTMSCPSELRKLLQLSRIEGVESIEEGDNSEGDDEPAGIVSLNGRASLDEASENLQFISVTKHTELQMLKGVTA